VDSLCTAAARALAAGDPLGALKRVALRDDAPALALRGVAMAQLGELARAKQLLRSAARAFGPREAVARARCEVAHAEVALAARDPIVPAADRALVSAMRALDAHGDRANALHARLVLVKRSLLLGRTERAEAGLRELRLDAAPPMLVAIAELLAGALCLRRVRTDAARAAFSRAREAASHAGIPALLGEIEQAFLELSAPVARTIRGGNEQPVVLAEVERLLASKELVVDACRRVVRDEHGTVAFSKRPVLFALLRALGEAWPGSVAREALVVRAFGARRINESHRARLRVEIGRLRKMLRALADVSATPDGFLLTPRAASSVVVLAPPIDGDAASLLALLGDGEAWSTSALALALGQSQRTVQRALSVLEQSDQVRSFGRARARRWLAPPSSGIATTLLLPASLSVG
jgi:hypothetical protein